MSYTLPTFNITCNHWFALTVPPVGPPDVVTPCNLARGIRVDARDTSSNQAMTGLFPKGTDIRSTVNQAHVGVCEIPAGTGRYYTTVFVDDFGKGFDNEHRFCILAQAAPWPAPMP